MEKKFCFMGLFATYDTNSSQSLRDAVKNVTAALEEALVYEAPRAEGEENLVQMFDAYAHGTAPWHGIGLAMVNAALLGIDVLIYVRDDNRNVFELADIAHVEKVRERWGKDAHVTGMQMSVRYNMDDQDILFFTPSRNKAPAHLMATVYRGGEECFTVLGEDMNVLACAMAGRVALGLMDKED